MQRQHTSWQGWLVTLGLVAGGAFAQDPSVSRDEFEQLKERLLTLEKAANPPAAAAASDAGPLSRLEVSLSLTAVVQGTSGVDETANPEGDVTDANLLLDLVLKSPVGTDGTAYVNLEAGPGAGLDDELPTGSGLNDTGTNDSHVFLNEAWYEHRFLDKRLAVRLGQLDLACGCGEGSAFDANAVANDGYSQFLARALVNNPTLEFPATVGAGVQLWAWPTQPVELGVGLAEADGDWENVFAAPFVIGQFGVRPAYGELQGGYRVYLWQNRGNHTRILNPAVDHANNCGCGISADQQLTKAVTVFARYGTQDDRVAAVREAWSGGCQVTGLFGRENDRLGVGYSRLAVGDAQAAADRAAGITPADEELAEAYYRISVVADKLEVTPDVQWVRHANGDAASDDCFVFGLRGYLRF